MMRLLAIGLALLSAATADSNQRDSSNAQMAEAGNALMAEAQMQQQQPNTEAARQQTDDLVFRTRLSEFTTIRESSTRAPLLNWYSNNCTGVWDQPNGVDFWKACQRHDFAYTNFKGQGRFYPITKTEIDKRFYWE